MNRPFSGQIDEYVVNAKLDVCVCVVVDASDEERDAIIHNYAIPFQGPIHAFVLKNVGDYDNYAAIVWKWVLCICVPVV